MTPAERRDWTRIVLGHADLTAAQKVVVIALSTYADFESGRRAFPGEQRLATDTGLGVRAVRYGLTAAVELGLIERTALPNRRGGRATTYALTMPAFTGTAVPVNKSLTGTAMPVKDVVTGTAVHHHRHGGATTTGIAVPPTIHRPPHEEGGGPVERSTGGAEGPGAPSPSSDSLHRATAVEYPHGPRCARHRLTEHPPACVPCGREREAAEAAAATAADQAAAERAAVVAAVRACPHCDDFGRRDSDLSDCPHHANLRTLAASA